VQQKREMSEVQAVIESVIGFSVAGVACGLKKDNRLDFALVVSDRPCITAGVFTRNEVKAAPVLVDMDRLQYQAENIRAVAINTGSANACTGRKGVQDAHVTASWVAESIGCHEENVLVMSTGVIGLHLPMDKIRQGVSLASASLGNDWQGTASAIMTTDTRPKYGSVTVRTAAGQEYTIAGIAKGSGMIAPDMATMLSVIVTDAVLSGAAQAKTALKTAIDKTFNCIAVDGDTSTNDTVVMMANGATGVTAGDEFQLALETLCRKLAQDIVRDGEGATKFIALEIAGAPNHEAARQIADTIATSPLVKTAFYGGDANWGRIIAAAGRAGILLDPEKMQLHIAPGETLNGDSLLLFTNGMPTEYDEPTALDIMRQPAISVKLDCGAGEGHALVWTCDLSHDYVSINGHYRT
jgi:glutamate N-acetyltransferase / amino-acid N-acetyltransferase